MGIIGSKQPRNPITAHIYLSRPKDFIYRPLDLIQGEVALKTTEPVFIPHIFVRLICESSVHLRIMHSITRVIGPHGETSTSYEFEHFRHDAVLLEEEKPIFSQRAILYPEQVCRFDFIFQVPERTNRPCLQLFGDRSSSDVWRLNQHSLPPSCVFKSPKRRLDEFGVFYNVEVALRPDQDIALMGAWRGPIQFCPLSPYTEIINPERNVATRPFRIKSSLLQEPPGTELLLHQRLRDKISSKTPHADFEITVEFPNQVTAGTQFMIRAAIYVLNRSEPQLRLPPVAFWIKGIYVNVTYHARAPRDWNACRDYRGNPQRRESSPGWLTRRTRSAQLSELSRQHPDRGAALRFSAVPDVVVARFPMMRDDTMAAETQGDSCDVRFAARLPLCDIPSFQSFALSRFHDMEVHLICMIGHQEFKMIASGCCSTGAADGGQVDRSSMNI